MRLLVEAIVLVNALGGLAALGVRQFFRRRDRSNVERVHELEAENEKIDEALERMRLGDPR